MYRVAVTTPAATVIPPGLWQDIEAGSDIEALHQAVCDLPASRLPLRVHVGRPGGKRWPSGVPLVTHAYTVSAED